MHVLQAAEVSVDWVFAYGSLIWNPEFDYSRSELGRLHGYHRAFCVRSSHYRGTPEQPGIVLGLDRGGSCTGMVFQLTAAHRARSIAKLFAREMPSATARVYLPRIVRVHLQSGLSVRALTFVADPSTGAYAKLSDGEIVARMARCCGIRGPNVDYLFNTIRALERHGVHDRMLARLELLAQQHQLLLAAGSRDQSLIINSDLERNV